MQHIKQHSKKVESKNMASLRDIIDQKRQDLSTKRAKYQRSYKWKPGRNVFRILPGWDENDRHNFSVPFGQHWVKDKEGSVIKTVADASICYGDVCPVREAILEAMRMSSVDDAYRKILKEGLASGRVLVNGSIIGDKENPPEKPTLLEFSETQFDTILMIFQEYIDADKDPFDLQEGLTLVLDKQGSGLETKYTITPKMKSDPLPATVLENLLDLNTFVKSQFDGQREAIAGLSKSVGKILGAPSTSAQLGFGFGGPGAALADQSGTAQQTYNHEETKTVEGAVLTGDDDEGADAEVVGSNNTGGVMNNPETVQETTPPVEVTQSASTGNSQEIEDILAGL